MRGKYVYQGRKKQTLRRSEGKCERIVCGEREAGRRRGWRRDRVCPKCTKKLRLILGGFEDRNIDQTYFEERPPSFGCFHHMGRAPIWILVLGRHLKNGEIGCERREEGEKTLRGDSEGKKRQERRRREKEGEVWEQRRRTSVGKYRLGCQSNPFPQG